MKVCATPFGSCGVLGGSASCRRFLQFRPHRVAFPRHVQLGKYIKGGSQLFALRLAISLCAQEKAQSPIVVSKAALIAQLQAERFPFLEQRAFE